MCCNSQSISPRYTIYPYNVYCYERCSFRATRRAPIPCGREESMTLTIAVPGVTGRLGGPLAELLLEHGHQIRALVRDQASPDVRRLQERGGTIVPGDFDDRSSMEEWATGADAVFI